MTMDGHAQRNALTAAEQAIRALGGANAAKARANAAKAAELDQAGVFAALPDAVGRAAVDLETSGTIGEAAWRAVEDAVGPGPLMFLVEEVRGG
jgi:hypothetical protein